MHDVIVVGARVAGAPTSMLAARAGLNVLLVDRASFPSDRLSTNYIHQPGCERLARWGVLDAVIASGAPPIPTTRLQVDDIVLDDGVSPDYVQREAYAPRRYVLDEILVKAARQSGVEVRENTTIVGVLTENGRCTGVELAAREKTTVIEKAALVVGADGMRSTVARLVGAEVTIEDPLMTCAYYTFWKNLEARYELYEAEESWVGAVPTNDSVLVATYFPQASFPRIRGDALTAHLGEVKATAPALYRRMMKAERVGKLWGTGEQRNFFRQACGKGWALVGDAGHAKDSITARGITDAFIQAELLVQHAAPHIGDPRALDEALERFAERRDALMMPSYRGTLAVARPSDRKQRIATLRAIADSPPAIQLYFDVVAGIRPFAELQEAIGRVKRYAS